MTGVTVSQWALKGALELVCRYGTARRDLPVHTRIVTMRKHGNNLRLCGTDNGAIACASVPVLQAGGGFGAGMWLSDAKKLLGSLQSPDASVTLAVEGAILDATTNNGQIPYVDMEGSDEVDALASIPVDATMVAVIDLDRLSGVARRAGAYRNPYLVVRTDRQEALASLWDEEEQLTEWTPVGSGHEVAFISVDPRYITNFVSGRARVAWKEVRDVPLWWFDAGDAVLTVAPMAPGFFEPWRRWRMHVAFPWVVNFQFGPKGREGYNIADVLDDDQVQYLDSLLQEAFPSVIEWYQEQWFSRHWDTPEGVRLEESADGQLMVRMIGGGNYPAIIHDRLWQVVWWTAWKMLYDWGVARYGHPCRL
jgi:hypothetical protein